MLHTSPDYPRMEPITTLIRNVSIVWTPNQNIPPLLKYNLTM